MKDKTENITEVNNCFNKEYRGYILNYLFNFVADLIYSTIEEYSTSTFLSDSVPRSNYFF